MELNVHVPLISDHEELSHSALVVAIQWKKQKAEIIVQRRKACRELE